MIHILNKERTLINSIRYGAIIIIIIFSFFTTNIFIKQESNTLKKEFQEIEKEFIFRNKIMTENLVNKIYSFVEVERQIGQKELKEKIKEQVNQAYSVMEAIYKQSIKKPDYSREKTIDLIKETIRNIRFNNDLGYIFIYETNGKNILNSQFPEIEGKDQWKYKDAKGTLLLQEMKKILGEKNETFYSWYWKKPKTNDIYEFEKLGFFKKFQPYNIFIGTGEYLEDFEKRLQKKALEKIASLKFKDPEHLFIYDTNGLSLINPKKELIGLNRYDSKNKDGRYVLREIIEYAQKNKEGFLKYKGSVILNEKNINNEKISFLKLFEDWNWVIGSGFYLEELYIQMKEKKETLEQLNEKVIKEILFISIIATIIMIIFCFYLSNLIASMFKKYSIEIKKEIKKSHQKEKLLIQQSKMATMGEMLGNIAHQWKQPLSLIAVSNSLIKLNQENKDFSTQEELKKAVNNIDISVKHLSVTIDEFRDFFKPEKEKFYFDLGKIFDKTYELISSQFKDNNIIFIKEINDIQVYGRPNELSQVLINLIKNAKDELVKLNNNHKKLIFVNIYKENSRAIIKIKDNAGGISKNIMNKIFDAYFTTKEEKEGTGIGLYMSRQIIQEMKGKIEVCNVEFQYENIKYLGAEFTIYLNLEDK